MTWVMFAVSAGWALLAAARLLQRADYSVAVVCSSVWLVGAMLLSEASR